MQIACSDIRFITGCTYPLYPRMVAPERVVLWWSGMPSETIVGQVTTATPKGVKAGIDGYHYAVSPGAITGLVPPQYLAYHFDTPPAADGLDSGLIHVALTGWARCTEQDSKDLFDAVASLICCLKEAYPSLQIILPSDIQPELLNEDEFPFHTEKPEFAELLRTMTADCEDYRNGRVQLSTATLEQMRSAPLSVAGLTSSLSSECQSCNCGCGCNSCATVGVGCCGATTLSNAPLGCDACGDIAALQEELTAQRQSVASMLMEFAKFQTWRAIWEPLMQSLAPKVNAIELDVEGIRIWAASAKDCLDCLCKTTSYSDPIEYITDPSRADMNCFVPNVNRWLQFPLRISDLNPAAVRLGALWGVNLPANKYKTEIHLELPPINYCTGCKVWVELVQCGTRTRIIEQVMTAGLQPLTLDWVQDLTIISPCPDLHFEIGTDTTLNMPAQMCVSSGYVRFTPCTTL
jgi:hypothetical protein